MCVCACSCNCETPCAIAHRPSVLAASAAVAAAECCGSAWCIEETLQLRSPQIRTASCRDGRQGLPPLLRRDRRCRGSGHRHAADDRRQPRGGCVLPIGAARQFHPHQQRLGGVRGVGQQLRPDGGRRLLQLRRLQRDQPRRDPGGGQAAARRDAAYHLYVQQHEVRRRVGRREQQR